MKKTVSVVILLAIISGILFWKYWPIILERNKEENKLISLTYWGFGDDEQILKPVIRSYQTAHPKVVITYSKQSLLNYRTRLQTQIKAGQGPDIFQIHSSWLPMLLEDLAPASDQTITFNDFIQTYYPLAKESLTLNNKIYALPLLTDGLGMYYNEEILKGVGGVVPKNWTDFMEIAKKATVPNQQGQIQTAGAALGTSANVDFWPEILSLLFLQQPEGNLGKPANKDGLEVLQFYTSFVTNPKNKTWDTTLPSSTQMFADGKLAFYFAPSSQIPVIKQLNPNLPFKVAPVPQLSGETVNLGNFWVGTVSNTSLNQKEAWDFLNFLNSSQVVQVIYQSRLGAFGFAPIYPRMDLASELLSDPILGAFVSQGPSYKGWYLNSNTQDGGVNDEMIVVYKQAVDSSLTGQDSLRALQAAEQGVRQILDKYKINK
ncbi:MAG: extracellular solute-binding protein [Candidatus Daviesbacteria bacterium]